ncbi:AI-2 transport protein TqsA [Polystyrenella longa]|uniref:AI-2 transport protein TqsA n=1 Tax=Polystyrenella longa TaxID=2528007 RepID=A0A518CLB1_9PLAN|nr:AI-2E family transporter [Polystyrenella longa]QDU80018.1 AI-2 transport protein TqsA [Polystyrenella longa]
MSPSASELDPKASVEDEVDLNVVPLDSETPSSLAEQGDNPSSTDGEASKDIPSEAKDIEEAKPRLGPPDERAKVIRKYAHFSLILLGLMAIVYALHFARAILIPVALSVIIFFLLSPLVRFMTRLRYVNESAAAGLIVIAFAVTTVIGSYYLTAPITEWVKAAPSTFRQAEEKLKVFYEPVGQLNEATEKVSKMTQGEESEQVVKVAVQQPPVTSYILNSTVNAATGAIICLVLVYLLLAGGHRSINSIVELMPSVEDKKGLVSLLRDIEQGISSYLLTITLINICLGIVIGTVLGLLGLPDPWLLGIMAALLNFIPFAGAAIGAAIVFMIGVVSLDAPLEIAIGPILYFTINSLEGNLVTPVILGRSMKLNPAIVFLCIIFWGWVWGIAGVLLAVPIIGITKISFSHFKELKPIAHILAG